MIESRRFGHCAVREKMLFSTMKLTISALALCAIAAARDHECKIGKCCPYGQVLSISDDFVCSLVEGEGEQVIHRFNCHESKAGFRCPKNEDVTIAALENIVKQPVQEQSACIDILHNKTAQIGVHVIFQCRPKRSSEDEVATGSVVLAKLPDLRMCCEAGESFDHIKRVCVSEEDKLLESQPNRQIYRGTGDYEKATLLCRSNGTGDVTTGRLAPSNFLSLRMCCSIDSVYSMEKRDCLPIMDRRNVPKNFPSLTKRFDFITVVRGAPPCEYAILDYVVNVTRDLRVRNDGGLEVILATTNGRETLIANETNTCLDRGVSARSDLVVFRVCSDSRFCREYPCVRKCCRGSQAWHPDQHYCTNIRDDAPTGHFHDVLLNESIARGSASHTDFLHNSNYGLLIGVPCKRVLDLKGSWHISPRGHVYLSDGKAFEHDDYCLEMSYRNATNGSRIYLMDGISCMASSNRPAGVFAFLHYLYTFALPFFAIFVGKF